MKQFLLFLTPNYLSCWRNYIIHCSTISIKEGLKRSTDVEKRRKMHLNVFFSALSLCFLNVSFMIVGMFLNSVVIISLWRSSRLRKEMCYFITLVLSCFDLAVVTITHPVLILSTILWSMRMYGEEIDFTRMNTSLVLGGFSMFALLTLNIERFLALTAPFFHKTSVTKGRLMLFMALLMIIPVALVPFYYSKMSIIGDSIMSVVLLITLFAFIFLNYKILAIVKSKRDDLRIAPTGIATPSHQQRNILKKKYKNISTCSLAVGCFFVCFCPEVITAIWPFTLNVPRDDRQAVLNKFWSNTLVAMNSTFNCVIFFWRSSILRREGMKIAKCLFT